MRYYLFALVGLPFFLIGWAIGFLARPFYLGFIHGFIYMLQYEVKSNEEK
jgi:hypothetical protein